MKAGVPVVSRKVSSSALSLLISLGLHLSLFIVLSYITFGTPPETLPVEVSLAPDETVQQKQAEKLEVKNEKTPGVKNPIIETKDKVPVVKQEMPNMAKGEKPGDKANIKDKGPVGKEYSKEGSPKGADEGYTWGDENMKIVRKITPQTRMSKDKSFSVRGEAIKEITADYIHFHAYVYSQEVEVSKSQKARGQINALRGMDQGMDNFKSKFKRAYLGRVKFELFKEGDPEIQMASIFDPVFKTMNYVYVARQKVTLTLDNKSGTFIDDYMKEIANAGGSFSPEFKIIQRLNKTIYYNKELDFSGSEMGGQPVFNTLEDYEKRNAELQGKALGKALKGDAGKDDTNGPLGTQDSFVTLSVKEESRKAAEKELKKLAIDDAKKKAGQQAKDLGIPIEDISPLVEATVENKVKKDLSGKLIIRVSVLLYY
ncbi:MAG: hypothetical protein A2231_06265 [Candidatus Firestonebacteria bacterium RIFOXYA2_FULL_40_8]|nr:MAG: hypothetical protein A2231_06265 [Candidatus Firestonebacteria bacterium RIFOXYA2_FULL_40_8]